MTYQIVVEGHRKRDAVANPEASVVLKEDGVELRDRGTGKTEFVATNERPTPGAKVSTSRRIEELCQPQFVSGSKPGGSASRIAASLGIKFLKSQNGNSVTLLNSGQKYAVADEICQRNGIECHSLGRQNLATNLEIAMSNDRVIVMEGIHSAAPDLQPTDMRKVCEITHPATVIVSASSKDAALSTGVVAAGNGASRYVQLPNGIGIQATLLLTATAHEVIGNLAQWCKLGRRVGMNIPIVCESCEDAPAVGASVIRRMRERGWAGKHAAICTLGRSGAVVGDWAKCQVYRVTFEVLDGTNGVPTPTGAGDRWFAEYIFLRESWSKRGHFRDPIAATALRSTHAIAHQFGLNRERYDAFFSLM